MRNDSRLAALRRLVEEDKDELSSMLGINNIQDKLNPASLNEIVKQFTKALFGPAMSGSCEF